MGKKSGIKRREVGVMTQEEVAKELGLSRAIIGKVERDAILKIKNILKRKSIKREDLI